MPHGEQKLSLDVNAPDEVADVLRAAANDYLESAEELDSAHQTKAAGRPWRKISRVLEVAADRIERATGPSRRRRIARGGRVPPEEAHEEGLENPPPTTVQTVVFDKAHWSPGKARAWLREHSFKFGKVDVKENTLRFRQRDPGDFKPEDFRTIRFGEPAVGIQAVIGHVK